MNDEYIIDRTTYKKIKAMDKGQLTALLTEVYVSGKKDAEITAIDLEALKTDISQIKGIGENRLNEIISVIEQHINIKCK